MKLLKMGTCLISIFYGLDKIIRTFDVLNTIVWLILVE